MTDEDTQPEQYVLVIRLNKELNHPLAFHDPIMELNMRAAHDAYVAYVKQDQDGA